MSLKCCVYYHFITWKWILHFHCKYISGNMCFTICVSCFPITEADHRSFDIYIWTANSKVEPQVRVMGFWCVFVKIVLQPVLLTTVRVTRNALRLRAEPFLKTPATYFLKQFVSSQTFTIYLEYPHNQSWTIK